MPTALITGASRGIGKAITLSLAGAGYDVVVSARTVTSGETRDNGLTVHRPDTRPLPGSLEETAQAVRALGRDALIVAADLTDRASVGAAGQRILDEAGGVDVIVHNGRYLGPGIMDLFLDTPLTAYEKAFEAHYVAPVILTRMLLPAMLERPRPQIVTIASSAAWLTPPAPAGQGGWGLAYAVGKAAGHPLVATLHTEYAAKGLRTFNVEPGYVATERNEIAVRDYGRELAGAAPPEAIGATIAWLLDDPESDDYVGTTVEAQELCLERRLYPAWTNERVSK
jgi:NAD(P)-dependent dehydrogenase (short-subunit alcohol dehydrogenase family)